jgi:uncharacterized protein
MAFAAPAAVGRANARRVGELRRGALPAVPGAPCTKHLLRRAFVAKTAVDPACPVAAGGDDDSPSSLSACPQPTLPPLPSPLEVRGDARLGRTLATAAAGAAVSAATAFVLDCVDTGMLLKDLEAVLADPHFWVCVALAAAAFVQALTGFGFAIVTVAALSQLDWIAHSSVFDTVQPIAATISCAIGWILIFPELRLVQWRRLVPAMVSTTLLTPVGAVALEYINAGMVLKGLGALIASYVLFTALDVKAPKILGSELGGWGMGALAGFLGGAFDISGPPLVIHGQAADWGQDFRRNLLSVLAINSTVIVTYDLVTGRLADFYYADFLRYAVPGVVVSMLAGRYVATRLDASNAKKVVLLTCFVMGIRLMLS